MGSNLNREWEKPSLERSPEVRHGDLQALRPSTHACNASGTESGLALHTSYACCLIHKTLWLTTKANVPENWPDKFMKLCQLNSVSMQVYHVMKKMEATGCDLFIDVHGDEVPFAPPSPSSPTPSFLHWAAPFRESCAHAARLADAQ